MSRRKHLCAASLCLSGMLAACAGLETQPPRPAPAAVDAQRAVMIDRAIEQYVARDARVAGLAWPILAANADLCEKRTTERFGIRFATAASVSDLIRGVREEDAREAGFGDAPVALTVVAGSPAALAGVATGDVVTSVNGEALADEDVEALLKALDEATEHDDDAPAPAVRFGLKAADGATREIETTPQEICEYPVVYTLSTDVNARTDGSTLTIFGGLERRLNDDALALVIAHELAHAILRHPRKGVRNAIVSGGAVIGPLAGASGWVVDGILALVDEKPRPSLQARGLSLTVPGSADFEREADYLAVYLMARAGLPLDGVEEAFAVFAEESPTGAWAELTHPVTPERTLAVKAAVAEVRRKVADDAPLLPEGWSRD